MNAFLVKFIKEKSLILVVFALFACQSVRHDDKERVPLWADSESISKVFPVREFLAITAFADNADEARLKADAELTSFFNSKVSSIVSATENLYNSENSSAGKRFISRQIDVSSSGQLIGLSHTEPYFDKRLGRYAVCAYINRVEAWKLIEPKLDSISRSFERSLFESRRETELFSKILTLNFALKNIDGFCDLYAFGCCVIPEKMEKFSSADLAIRDAVFEKRRLAGKSSFGLVVKKDVPARVKAKTLELFAREGFSISETNSMYIVDLQANVDVLGKSEMYFCYPRISVSIKRRDGSVLSSWSKDISKVSSYTKEACERMALAKIEYELENDFALNVFNNIVRVK